MSPRINNDQELVSLTHPRQTSMVSGLSQMAPRTFQDDDLSSQDTASLCSLPSTQGTIPDLKEWNMNSSESIEQAMSSKDSPQVQMLSFSLSQQLMTSTVGPSEVMYAGVDFPAVSDHDMHRDFYSFVDLSSMDNDVCGQTSTPDDAQSVALSAHTDDGHFIAGHESWNAMMADGQYPGNSLDQLSANLYQTMPVSPPLTEASNDIPITSACSQSGFTSFFAPDDSFLGEYTTSPMGNPLNPAEPLFPISTPLSEKDPNRTIRQAKPSRRGTLPVGPSQVKSDQEFFPSLPAREPTRPKSKDSVEARNPRDHHFYHLAPQNDGKYYCPFASGEKPCSHPPTTQKCAYHKYLDSHLKPYRCKHASCVDNMLRFSSNACLFRHEREAHGMHGHGECPHLCLFEGCERSVPGFGFPRRWNLHDHMKRVHDYVSCERPSSQPTSQAGSQPSSPEAVVPPVPTKKKDSSSSSRKRRGVTDATPAPTMKRTRSVHSQSTSAKASQASAQNAQRLQNAERNYYKCRSRLLDELTKITPQDISLHEKVNASLQELYTLGLQYRHLEAGHAVSRISSGMPV
ncbi:hypothetical protein N7539_007932 [Penicillium diatomitis]|uniref:C2H2-type domain-containing protein n=1 Tax=Penicillium diatomitis TaxID=2819901 RepID=A0A9X0BNF4_9EURO|nr:uncharacterized protein N7539_007932 [Penicillium diatomitis]KAJ5475645.1 hypothetical protein N7539_007932 [Penicillium diatomitis]